ncbi:MAG TPA: GNAT family N-acetyltransferase [Syntrophomonadaceae bacterium]|nr:GNAT family N-acetyltransferase [Syntrophomonadaceae bacterium]
MDLGIEQYFKTDPWLASMINKPVYNLSNTLTLDEGYLCKEKTAIYSFLHKESCFCYIKVPIHLLGAIKHLTDIGFNLVDTSVILKMSVSGYALPGNYQGLRFAVPEDEISVCQIAGRAFTFSRFHTDKDFTTDMANQIKTEWARNFFRGKRGEYMVVAYSGELAAGFLQLLYDGQGVLTIDLIAVDSSYRQMGIAQKMIEYALANCSKVGEIRVGTQLVNLASVSLYEKMGFRLMEAYHVMHYHL